MVCCRLAYCLKRKFPYNKEALLLLRRVNPQESSVDLRQRLLELFPATSLRKTFVSRGTKEKVSRTVASSSDTKHLGAVADFIDKNVPLCKQHVYVFSHDGEAVLPQSITNGEMVKSDGDHALYLARIEYTVVQLDPLKRTSIDFLWPIRIELHQNYLLVRFVVLEKSIGSYFEQEVMVRGKSLSEETIMGGLLADGTVSRADLNKGFKALWHRDRIDAARIRYKEPEATVTRAMDEEKGLKKTNPEKYEELRRFPLHQSVFIPRGGFAEVGAFTADPTEGFIGFTRYFKEGATGDELIRQILSSN